MTEGARGLGTERNVSSSAWQQRIADLNAVGSCLPDWLWEVGVYRILDDCWDDIDLEFNDPACDRLLVARLEDVLKGLGYDPPPMKAMRRWVQDAKAGVEYVGEIAERMHVLDQDQSFDWLDD